MIDGLLNLLADDPEYHSFTLDGHTIPIADYLEMRPDREDDVRRAIRRGRIRIGPYFTLAEQFSVDEEALVRNLLFGGRMMDEFDAPATTVAYTPASWGQTGQLPQILRDFGLTRMMFYRGISHDEAPAEWIWRAPDGSEVNASRFALYARYNWYYQVHRPVTRGRVFDKDYRWGEFADTAVRET